MPLVSFRKNTQKSMRKSFFPWLTAIAIPACLITLASCNPVEELEEDCAAGDADACEILDTIDAAVAELEEAIPEGVTLASVFEAIEEETSSSEEVEATTDEKLERINEALEPQNIRSLGLAGCLKALPPKPPVRDPICYGPRINYENHPNGNSPNSGQLPQGDSGLWLDTEPRLTGAGKAPCAAVKMRELVAKSLHNIDLATGSVAMMVCAAAHEKIGAPKNDGDTLNFASILNQIPNSPFTITTATLTRVDANSLKAVFVAEHDDNTDSRFGSLSITTTHNHTTQEGLVQIERTGANENRVIATSARYRPKPGATNTRQVQLISGRMDQTQITDFYNSNGEVKLGPISQAENTQRRNIEDTHYLLAEFAESGTQTIAYGWNAGGNDSHFRVFNAKADGGTANAWYGFAPNPYANNSTTSSTSEKPDLDLSATGAGMICNWAGPGHSHTVKDYLQHQRMTKNSNDRWVLTAGGSKIRYVPTNSCELTTNSNTSFTAVHQRPSPTTEFTTALAAHDITAGDTFSLGALDALSAKSLYNITIPISW